MTISVQPQPRVKLVATGGTIALPIDPVTGRPARSPTELALGALEPEIAKYARVDVEQFSLIASTQAGPAYWVELSERLNEIIGQEDVSGVVVTHGTDTMEETGFFLELTVNSDIPVVLTGAQRNPGAIDVDGPGNLLSAVRVAASEEARRRGVLVVMNGKIHAARDITKGNTWSVDAFESGELGILGYVCPDAVRFYRQVLRRKTFDPRTMKNRVDIVTFYAGADGRLIRAAMAARIDGLVIEGAGLGNVNEDFDAAIREVVATGIPVVVTSRARNGRVFPWYHEPGGTGNLVRYGVILADNLRPQKARILLMLALGVTSDCSSLQNIFANI